MQRLSDLGGAVVAREVGKEAVEESGRALARFSARVPGVEEARRASAARLA